MQCGDGEGAGQWDDGKVREFVQFLPTYNPSGPPSLLSLSLAHNHPHTHTDGGGGGGGGDELYSLIFWVIEIQGKNQSLPHVQSIYVVEICMILWVLDFSYSHTQLC